ncbi:6080_t:CDS:2 [Diversispora eburnea]|uniref:6080_t:CDS:1 n=1 Tax=Diversispora eburnea TaxID=1213867 RepID=A0A9N8YLV4_9GLOM|nr:6080_t:CDS:2 [Diversispora eburnea]
MLIYSFEIYKSIVQHHVIYGEWKRLKYYAMISFLFPLFVGIVPPYLIADKDGGVAPGAFFCILNKPSIPLVFVSIAGWNTVLSLFGIYFSLRTLIVVAKLFFVHGFYVNFRFSTPVNENNHNISSSGSSSSSISHNSLSHSRSRSISSSKIPIYVFFRLTLFFIMYCGITVIIYGRCLIIGLKQEDDLNVKEPKYIGYITASLGIVIFLIFGTSMEAGRAYWGFLSIILNWFNWVTCFKKILRDDSFGDWETKQKQQMRRDTGETEEEREDSTVIDEQIINREVSMVTNREITMNNTTIDIEQDNNREIITATGEIDEKHNQE